MSKEYLTMKEAAEIEGVAYLTIFKRLHKGVYGEEGEGWERDGPYKHSKILISSKMLGRWNKGK